MKQREAGAPGSVPRAQGPRPHKRRKEHIQALGACLHFSLHTRVAPPQAPEHLPRELPARPALSTRRRQLPRPPGGSASTPPRPGARFPKGEGRGRPEGRGGGACAAKGGGGAYGRWRGRWGAGNGRAARHSRGGGGGGGARDRGGSACSGRRPRAAAPAGAAATAAFCSSSSSCPRRRALELVDGSERRPLRSRRGDGERPPARGDYISSSSPGNYRPDTSSRGLSPFRPGGSALLASPPVAAPRAGPGGGLLAPRQAGLGKRRGGFSQALTPRLRLQEAEAGCRFRAAL